MKEMDKDTPVISARAAEKVGNAVLISGLARSGTTIVGKMVGSFDSVEYAFEPPTLVALYPLIRDLPESHWQYLYEAYLYEDFFLNAISGRNINCNRNDDSSIFNIKSQEDVEARHGSSMRKLAAEEIAGARVIAYKIPDIVQHIPLLKSYYPDTRVVIVHRGAVETVNSLMAKGWLSDKSLSLGATWPLRRVDGENVPLWVKEQDYVQWRDMSELDRCAYYYVTISEQTRTINGRFDVRYDALLREPMAVAQRLSDYLGCSLGGKTLDVVASVRPSIVERDSGLLAGVRSDIAARITSLAEDAAGLS